MFDKRILMNQKRMFLKKLIWMQMLGLTGGSLLPWATFTGNPVSFNAPKAHAFKSFSFDIDPVQDLHGYDNPWPAGGGKNLIGRTLDDIKAANPSGTWNNNVNEKDGITATFEETDGYISSIKINGTASAQVNYYLYPSASPLSLTVGTSYRLTGCPSGGGTDTWGLWATSQGTIDNGSGTTFTADNANPYVIRIRIASGAQLNNLVFKPMVCLSSASDPSSFAPYSNICPISGWTGAKLWRTGKNLLGGQTLGQAIVDAVNNTAKSDFGENTDGKYVTINASSATQNKPFTNGIKFKENTRYTFIAHLTRYQVGTALNANIGVLYADGTTTTVYFAASTETAVATIVLTTAANKTVECFRTLYGGGVTRLFYEKSGIFEGVLTTDDFVAYQGSSLTLPFGQTVYGGNADVVGGSGTSEWREKDYGDLSWSLFNTGFYAPLDIKASATEIVAKAEDYKSLLSRENADAGPTADYSICGQTAGHYIYVKDTRYATAAAFKTAKTGKKFIYMLPTPTSFTISSADLFGALKGENNVWADTGSVTLEAIGEEIQLNSLQSLNLLLGNRYVNNHTAEDVSDEEALDIILGR